jgi:hypothetical protein
MPAPSEDQYDAYTEGLLSAPGYTLPLIADVVNAGFAATKTERTFTGEEAVEITRVRITYGGRRALAEPQA